MKHHGKWEPPFNSYKILKTTFFYIVVSLLPLSQKLNESILHHINNALQSTTTYNDSNVLSLNFYAGVKKKSCLIKIHAMNLIFSQDSRLKPSHNPGQQVTVPTLGHCCHALILSKCRELNAFSTYNVCFLSIHQSRILRNFIETFPHKHTGLTGFMST